MYFLNLTWMTTFIAKDSSVYCGMHVASLYIFEYPGLLRI